MALLTITRGSLGASRQVAEAVGRELGCDVVTREQVIDHARQYGVEETGIVDIDYTETHPPHFWDRHAAQRRLYLILLKASLMDFVAKGNIIYLGHMGQFILSDVPKLLRIRVDASMDFRVSALTGQAKLSEAEAIKQIKKIDDGRRGWAKFLYDADYDAPSHYDLVLNLERMSLESSAKIISCAVKSPEWEPDDDMMTTIKNVHVSSIISAHLARSPRTRGMELTVQCDAKSGHASISGVPTLVGAETWEHDIREVVLGVEGVESLEITELH